MSNRKDFPMAGRHIHFLRIRAFASEGISFTEKETAHFDVCRGCRLNVLDALRKLAPGRTHYAEGCLNNGLPVPLGG
jgi:hypothetical protein